MCTLAYNEDPDEMPHHAAFHHSLYCLLSQNQSSEKVIQFYLKIITCDRLIYTMNHSKPIVSNHKEELISAQRVESSIRIYHECEGWIEKSVPRIAVWHQEACRLMTNGDPEGRIFLSYPTLTGIMVSFSRSPLSFI